MQIIIMGAGKVGEYLARTSLNSGHGVVLIEADADRAEEMAMVLPKNCLVIHGDGCDSQYLEDAGIATTDLFVAASGRDDNNLVACEIAMRVHGVSRCIARVNNPKNVRIFRKLGIESVSSTVLIAHLIEEEATMGSVSAISVLNQNNIGLVEIAIPAFAHHDPMVGVAISDLDLPVESTVVSVGDAEGMSIAQEDDRIYPGNKVVVAAGTSELRRVRMVFRNL